MFIQIQTYTTEIRETPEKLPDYMATESEVIVVALNNITRVQPSTVKGFYSMYFADSTPVIVAETTRNLLIRIGLQQIKHSL